MQPNWKGRENTKFECSTYVDGAFD